jgi:hypothetical protein
MDLGRPLVQSPLFSRVKIDKDKETGGPDAALVGCFAQNGRLLA